MCVCVWALQSECILYKYRNAVIEVTLETEISVTLRF